MSTTLFITTSGDCDALRLGFVFLFLPTLNGHRIAPSPTVTCLGVNIHPELTFASHTKRVAARCFYKLRQLRTIRHSLSADNARMLVHALVSTQVDYCNSILYQVAAVHLRPLQSVLNAAARLIVMKQKYDHITPTLRDDLHWLPVKRRIEYKLILILFVFKCRHQMAPSYLSMMCAVLPNQHLTVDVTRTMQLPKATWMCRSAESATANEALRSRGRHAGMPSRQN